MQKVGYERKTRFKTKKIKKLFGDQNNIRNFANS